MEHVWQRFLAWLPTIPPSQHPGTLLQAYRQHLQLQGVPPADVDAQCGAILQFMRVREDGWQQIFNAIYSNPQAGFTPQPNAWLVAAVEGRTPGRALDAGMGQGRNSVFLASQGWEVTGFDIADEGLAIARRNAAAAGLTINAVHQGHRTFDYGVDQWDLIFIAYEPFPLVSEEYLTRLHAALKPGGLLIVESFASESAAPNRKPVDIDPPVLLHAVLPMFRVLRFEDTEAIPDWTLEKSRLVRLVAEKASG